MAIGSRGGCDIDGLAGRKAAPSGVVATVTGLIALLAAILATLTHYGGGLWQLVVMLAVASCAVLSAWLLTYRQFIGLVTVLLAFTFPMALNVQFYDFPEARLKSGMPPGIALWEKDIFLLLLWVDWFVDVCLRRNRPSARIGPAARWVLVMIVAALTFPVHSIYYPASIMLWVELVRYALAFVYLAKKVDSRTVLKWIVIGILAQVWIESLISWVQYAMGSTLGLEFLGETRVKTEKIEAGALIRTGALLGHPNRFAEWLVLVGPFPLAMALLPKLGSLARAACWATFLALNVTLVLTFSRAGWVCAVFNILATWYLVNRRAGKPMVIKLWAPVIAGIALAVVLFLSIEEIQMRLTMDDQGSTFARVPQFVTAANIIAHNPFAGTGLGSYTAFIPKYAAFDGRYISTLTYRVHNGLLLWTAETGVVGGFAYLMFWFYFMKKAWGIWRLRDDFLAFTGIATVVGLCSWWVKSMYNIHSPLTDHAMWLHAAMIYVVWNCARRKEAERQALAPAP